MSRRRAIPRARPRRSSRALGRALRRHEWFVVGAMGAVGLVLGYVGFARHATIHGQQLSFWDLVYLVLQLIPLNSGAVAGPVPWQLIVARLLVPAVAGYAAVSALTAVFSDQVLRLRLRFLRRHLVICGLGRMGALLAERFTERGTRVVVIEREGRNPHIEASREAGAWVITGDATLRETLRAAGVQQARYLIAVCGDDGVNAEVAVTARELRSSGAGRSAPTSLARPRSRTPRWRTRDLRRDLRRTSRRRSPKRSGGGAGSGDPRSGRHPGGRQPAGARRPAGSLTCIIQLADPPLAEWLRGHALTTHGPDGFRLEMMDVYDIAARALLKAYPAPAAGRPPHLLVVGAGRLGYSLILQAAFAWHERAEQEQGRLRIFLIDLQAGAIASRICLRYPHFAEACDLIPHPIDVRGPEFEHGAFLPEGIGQATLGAVYVCLDDESLALETALALDDRLRGSRVPIVVRMGDASGLARLIQSSESAGGSAPTSLARPRSRTRDLRRTSRRRSPKRSGGGAGSGDPRSGRHPGGRQPAGARRPAGSLRVFAMLEHVCQPEMILGGVHEILARAIHEDYRKTQLAQGLSPEASPALQPWEELGEDFAEANRLQADHIGVKLAAVGCALAPLTDWRAVRFEFTPQEIEALARMEHERWVEDTRRAGWRHAPGAKDLRRRTHPSLVPWEDLSEVEMEKDRATARGLPGFLARAGLQIVRIPEYGPQ